MRIRRAIAVTSLLLFAVPARSAQLCLGPDVYGINGTVDCASPVPDLYPNSWTGFSTSGPPCETPKGANAPCSFGPPLGFGWSISSSPTDPDQNTGEIQNGVLYLWLRCTLGAQAAEFAVGGDIDVVDFTPMNLWLNLGSATQLLLYREACAGSPMVAGAFTVALPTPVETSSWGEIKSSYR